MKLDPRWATASLVAIATAVGLTNIQPRTPDTQEASALRSTPPVTPTKKLALTGPCHTLRSRIGGILFIDPKTITVPVSCKKEEDFTATQTQPSASTNSRERSLLSTHFVIATLPDPAHTHLPLLFDRSTEAIQQAASDSGYTYDSSWLPWDADHGEHPLLADQDIVDSRADTKEDQPGILLFRKTVDPQSPARPYSDVLIVFIVGEQATDGIHRGQFENAVEWASIFGRPSPSIQILGPSFSGSLPSLTELLRQSKIQTNLLPGKDKKLQIYSGQVTNNAGVNWFRSAYLGATPACPDLQKLNIQFLSFQQDDDEVIRRYQSYLAQLKLEKAGVAIVSEDETAYGAYVNKAAAPSPDTPQTEGHCTLPQPVDPATSARVQKPETISFYYPRDISAVRAAYQEQSLFTRSPAPDASRRTLQSNLSDPEGKQHDSVRAYGASQTAISQEAVLLQTVNMMRVHRIQFILLRSSNPLDQLFLAHFFKQTYPEGRVVILGNDLLLRREVGSTGLTGIMTLSTYPLLPNLDDWTCQQDCESHAHRTFTQDGAQGTYTALRFLLNNSLRDAPIDAAFLPANPAQSIPGYAEPWWLFSPEYPARKLPVTWLSVLGNDGFWPVASLNGPTYPVEPSLSSRLFGALHRTWSEIFFSPPPPAKGQKPMLVPLSMNLALISVLLWAVFHAFCCCAPSVTVKPEHRSYFVHMRRIKPRTTYGEPTEPVGSQGASHFGLIVGSSVLLVIVATVLAWGYGWMSAEGEPILHQRRYALFPVVVWCICAVAIALNAWVEKMLGAVTEDERSLWFYLSAPGGWRNALRNLFRSTFRPLFFYTVTTVGFYIFFVLALDSTLPVQIKTLTYFRSMNLTTGVSPILPLVLLSMGMYGWCWQALRGAGLFNADRPLLPPDSRLEVNINGQWRQFLSMIGAKYAGTPMVKLARPFDPPTWIIAALSMLLLIASAAFISGNAPLRSLGTQRYSYMVCFWIAISISVLLANAWQLMHIWLRLHSMLVFLDKLPLRRTMRAMHGFTWGSIWKMSGNVFDVRYKLFYRQFEALNHLSASFDHVLTDPLSSPGEIVVAAHWKKRVEDTHKARRNFASWYAQNWHDWKARDLAKLRIVQITNAKLVGELISGLLVPAWGKETESIQIGGTSDEKEAAVRSQAALKPYIRNSEEVACLLYLGFIQNILGRMRAMVVGMVWLFLSIAFVVPCYPFDPRPVLTGAVIFLFIAVGTVIFLVYSQMFRDATLSNLTDTNAGELGSQFWWKLIGFGAGPLIGLLTSVFPRLNDFILSWIQPGLSSLK